MASAWAGRFTGLGNILGYLLGSLPLPLLASNAEVWRFRYMSMFAVLVLSSTIAVTLYFIREEGPEEDYEQDDSTLIVRTYRGVLTGLRSMPPRAQSVCRVQFFSAMGWFGFLFYSTRYVSGPYLEEMGKDGIGHSSGHKATGMRLATIASLLFAIVALSMNLLLPRLMRLSSSETPIEKRSIWTCLQSLRRIHVMWALGQLLYALLALSTFIINSSTVGTAAVATATIAWGVTQRAPYTLLGEEISAHQSERTSMSEIGGKAYAKRQSGAMPGVHSVAVSIPQMMASIASSGIFWLAANVGLHDPVGWVLRCSGVFGMVAPWFAYVL
jgi:solute carrier family 45 protein 1/2/4